MKTGRYILSLMIILTLQVLICNYVNLSQFVMISVLPLVVLFLPAGCGPIAALLVAFSCGFAVDFLSDGLLGLNALALTPVAMLRKGIIRLVFSEEVIARKENISIQRSGPLKASVAIFLMQMVFLAIYVWADAAGTRSFGFQLARWSASLAAGTLASLLLGAIISPDDRSRWK